MTAVSPIGNCARYFRRPWQPMPAFGQGPDGFHPREYNVRKLVSVVRLVPTNKNGYLNEQIIDKYVRRGGDGLWVVEHDELFYIAEGHHHAAAEIVIGHRAVVARVKVVA
jgi:hypothetical protein